MWEYHREAVHVYTEALLLAYQSDVEALFRHCATVMGQGQIPAALAGDWSVVREYLHNAAASIRMVLDKRVAERYSPEFARTWAESPPPAIRFELLATLTNRRGTQQLHEAALAVREHVTIRDELELDQQQRVLLERIVSGASIAEIARELGYSQRSIYRALSKLWDTLGVPNRSQAVHKALREGLLD